MAVSESECVDWLFGRGLSIGCNLPWSVPAKWRSLPREAKIKKIKDALRHEMDQPSVNCTVIHQLLRLLERHTAAGWQHLFITTNWDYLLQREILSLNLNVQPSWLANSHVFHLNGIVEDLSDNSHRSPFLLEEDPAAQRCFTPEANIAYSQMIWHRTFVVVGMSFECETDKFLLNALGRVEDDLPIGESVWVVVNPDGHALQLSCSRISKVLPHASVKGVCTTLCGWVNSAAGGLIVACRNSKNVAQSPSNIRL